jgi:hypothetical protein
MPEVVSELIMEMHEVRAELRALREDIQAMHGLREDMQAMPERIGTAVIKSLEPFLNRLLDHGDQLRSHESRLNNLEKPQ